MAVATAAALASDASPALPAPAVSAASLLPGAIGHTGIAFTQASQRDDGNGHAPITAAPTVTTPASTSAPPTASTSAPSAASNNRPAAHEPGSATGANLPPQGAAGTTASARAAAMSPGFASVVASARPMAGVHTSMQGDGAATARTAGTTADTTADDTVRSAGRGSGLTPVADRAPTSEAAAGVDRRRAAFGLRTDTEQITLPVGPDLPRDPDGSARPSTGAGTPSAAAGPGPALTPASLATLAAQAAQAAHATQTENRAGTAATDRVGAAEPGVSSLMAPAPISGSAPATAVTTSASAGAAPAGVESRIPVPLDSPAFAPALGAQISLFARDGVQTARLQLNPAEMGPITVQIALDGSAARVDFQADLASTREVIEASLPALAGALQEAGMTLAGGGVSQQPSSHQPPAQAEHPTASRRAGDHASGTDAPPQPTPLPTRTRGLVDLVA
jgi:flagellar hook-length control protein FliK